MALLVVGDVVWGGKNGVDRVSELPVSAPVTRLCAHAVPSDELQSAVADSRTLFARKPTAVALPSAPGFFGVYHSACRLALERFGFPAETAVAAGTLLHAVFWLTTSGLGLLALRGAGARLGDLDPDAGLPGERGEP